jgi:hypothetical protein
MYQEPIYIKHEKNVNVFLEIKIGSSANFLTALIIFN